MIKKLMAKLNAPIYGQVGNVPARKYPITGTVEIFHVNAWIKATKEAAKQFAEPNLEEMPSMATVAPPPPVEKPVVKQRRVSAANIEQQAGAPADQTTAPPAIDFEAVRRRQEADMRQAMLEQRSGTEAPLPEGEEELPLEAPPGDPALLAQRIAEILQVMSEIQFSSANGYGQLQMCRMQMKEALDEYNGVFPTFEGEQE